MAPKKEQQKAKAGIKIIGSSPIRSTNAPRVPSMIMWLTKATGSTPSGPPVPAAGLPEGWTMEQWNHYGAQWLKDQEELNVSTPSGFDFDL